MIPADHITIDGDTAWLVVASITAPFGEPLPAALDRPCDTCGGTGLVPPKPEPHPQVPGFCPDCDGTGRHTFTIGTRRVHVVPGMVVPIMAASDKREDNLTERCIIMWDDYAELFDPDLNADRWTRIALPIAAQPGMYAVQLEVHQ